MTGYAITMTCSDGDEIGTPDPGTIFEIVSRHCRSVPRDEILRLVEETLRTMVRREPPETDEDGA